MTDELYNKLNKYLANAGVNYVKIHNLHWNVVGRGFIPVHTYLDDKYAEMAEILDFISEAMIMNGRTPIATMKDYLELATIKEVPSEPHDIKFVLETMIADYKILIEQAMDIRKTADEEDLSEIVNFVEDNVASYKKSIWFAESMLK